MRAKQAKAYRQKRYGWAFLLPSLLGVALFFIIPFFGVIYYALVDSPVYGEFAGLDNFISLMENKAFARASVNTLIFAGISVPLVIVFALVLALLLNTRLYARSALRTSFLSPMVIPVASVVLIWQVLFHFNGSLNALVQSMGLSPVDWMKTDWARVVVIIVFVWKNAGYDMVILLAALQNVPGELLDAARVDGAPAWTRFMRITLPHIMPTGMFVLIMSLINSFKVFRETYLVMGDYPHESVYMLQHYMNNMFASLDYQKLAAAAIVMAIVITGLVMLLLRVEAHYSKAYEA